MAMATILIEEPETVDWRTQRAGTCKYPGLVDMEVRLKPVRWVLR